VNELFRNTDPHGVTDVDILDPDTTTPAEGQAAFEVEQRIKTHVHQMRGLWIRLAEDLYTFANREMWRDLGHKSFDEWLAGPDIDLGRRTVYGLIEVWKELVVNRGVRPHQIADVPVSKLRDSLAAVRRGFVDAEDAIADARTLGRDDLRERYRQLSTPTGRAPRLGRHPPDESGYVPGDTPSQPAAPVRGRGRTEWAICHACGSRYRVKKQAA
jgi:hypothetical protein